MAPSIKVQKLENLKDKCCSTGCQWFSLNAPVKETPLYNPGWIPLLERPFILTGYRYTAIGGVDRRLDGNDSDVTEVTQQCDLYI